MLLAVALPTNALYAAATLGLLPAGWTTILGYAALALGAPTLAAVYVVAVHRLTPRLALLAAAGSMPLAGYVTQGRLAGALFHGWGLGLFGTLGNAALLGMAFLIWGAVTLAAIFWRRKRERGPLDAALHAAVGKLGRSGSRT